MAGEAVSGPINYGEIDNGKVLNKEGLLELCSQIKTEIANNSGGKSGAVPLFTLLRLIFNGGNSQNNRQLAASVAQSYTNDSSVILGSSNIDQHLANLNAYGMTYINGCMGDTIANLVDGVGDDATISFKFMKGVYQQNYRSISLSSTTAKNASNYNTVGSYVSNQPVLVIFDKTKPYGNPYRWYIIAQPERSFENMPFYSQKGLASTDISNAIDEVATRIPSAPAADGTYTLQCVVSSGTPTYSWMSV